MPCKSRARPGIIDLRFSIEDAKPLPNLVLYAPFIGFHGGFAGFHSVSKVEVPHYQFNPKMTSQDQVAHIVELEKLLLEAIGNSCLRDKMTKFSARDTKTSFEINGVYIKNSASLVLESCSA